MRQQADSSTTRGNIARNVRKHSSAEAIKQFKLAERVRWKKRFFSFIFIGAIISLLVHINIGFLLSLLMRGGFSSESVRTSTTVEFAIQDSVSLAEMPEGQFMEQEVVQTEATSDSFSTDQTMLTADLSTTSLNASTQSMTPSLAGGGGGGMEGGMGGSGGGTSFFGISSVGSRFCYIVDISGSMNQQGRLGAAISELTKSLKKLPDFARFYVLFYSNRVVEPSIQKGWNSARSSTIRRMEKEFDSLHARGGTIPEPAFQKAFSLDPLPEVIFFLTDGEISGFTAEKLRTIMPKRHKFVVNTIAFGNSANQTDMIDIAKATGGQYKFVQSGRSP